MSQADTQLIVPRRNFLIRALGFTAAGATMAIPIVTLSDARSRIDHHAKELERAWCDYYTPEHNVRICDQFAPVSPPYWDGEPRHHLSAFSIFAGGAILGERAARS
jgi:hypothetical protein